MKTRSALKNKNITKAKTNQIPIAGSGGIDKTISKKTKKNINIDDKKSSNTTEEMDVEDSHHNEEITQDTPQTTTASHSKETPSSSQSIDKGKGSAEQQTTESAANQQQTNQTTVPDDAIFEKITRRTPYRAATLLNNIKGKSTKDKAQTVCKQFGNVTGYAGKITQTIKGSAYMVIYFDTKKEMMEAIDQTFDLDADHEYKYLPYQEIRQQPTPLDKNKEKERTIQIIDIPLEIRAL